MERWSFSQFWKLVPAKPNGSNALDLNQSTHGVKTEISRGKHNNKVPSARVDNGSTRSSFDFERSRRTFRKPLIHSVEISDPEAAKTELEKVKRSLRKVHESAFPPAAEDDKPKQIPGNIFSNSVQQVPKQTKGTEDPYNTLPVLVDIEAPATRDSMLGLQSQDNATDDDKIFTENKDSSVKQEKLDNKNQKVTSNESSEAKNESSQNGSNKQPKVPSYMLATKSAKAKLRDSSALLDHESHEKSHSTRRHSLPSITQKLTPANGKAKNKRDKSLTASKDGIGKAHLNKAFTLQHNFYNVLSSESVYHDVFYFQGKLTGEDDLKTGRVR